MRDCGGAGSARAAQLHGSPSSSDALAYGVGGSEMGHIWSAGRGDGGSERRGRGAGSGPAGGGAAGGCCAAGTRDAGDQGAGGGGGGGGMSLGATTASGTTVGAPASIPPAFDATASNPVASSPDEVTRIACPVDQAPTPSRAMLPWGQASGAGGSDAPATGSGPRAGAAAGTDRPVRWSSSLWEGSSRGAAITVTPDGEKASGNGGGGWWLCGGAG